MRNLSHKVHHRDEEIEEEMPDVPSLDHVIWPSPLGLDTFSFEQHLQVMATPCEGET